MRKYVHIHEFTNKTSHFSTMDPKAPGSIKNSNLPKSQHLTQTYQQHRKLYKLYSQFNFMFPHKLSPQFIKKVIAQKYEKQSNFQQLTCKTTDNNQFVAHIFFMNTTFNS
jgi:hypothetical protein